MSEMLNGTLEIIRTGGPVAWASEPRDLSGSAAHEKLRRFYAQRREATIEDVSEREEIGPALEEDGQTTEEHEMGTYRNFMTEQEEAWLAMLLKTESPEEEVAKWRKENGLHHKTVEKAVNRIQRSTRLAAMGEKMAAVAAPPDATEAPEPERIVVHDKPLEMKDLVVADSAKVPTFSADVTPLDPVIDWLGRLRAMRDDLAKHGVAIKGNLSIEIEL